MWKPRMRAVALILLVTLQAAGGCRENTYVAPPPPTVTVQNPVVKDVLDYLVYTGRTRAVESVKVEARVKGYLQSMHYTPGSDVKKGDLLFIIDPKPFEVDVAAKKAELSSRQAEAALGKTTFERSRQLYRQKATSEIEYLRFKAERDKANAAVLGAEAALADAELNLDYAYVKSPIDGRAGRHQVDLGNLVGAGETTLLADVVDYSPLFVYFQISELDVLRIQRQIRNRGAAAGASAAPGPDRTSAAPASGEESAASVAPPASSEEAENEDASAVEPPDEAEAVARELASQPVDAEPADEDDLEPSSVGYEASGGTRYGRSPGANVPPVEVGLADEVGYPHKGFLDFADSAIDDATGTLELRGVLENEGAFEEIILPGSFTRVRIPVGRFEDAVLVPERAFGADQGGRFLLLVGQGDVVEQRYVEVAGSYDGMRRVVSGVAPTDRVVVNGLQRARPGAKVTPQTEQPEQPGKAEEPAAAAGTDPAAADAPGANTPPAGQGE